MEQDFIDAFIPSKDAKDYLYGPSQIYGFQSKNRISENKRTGAYI